MNAGPLKGSPGLERESLTEEQKGGCWESGRAFIVRSRRGPCGGRGLRRLAAGSLEWRGPQRNNATGSQVRRIIAGRREEHLPSLLFGTPETPRLCSPARPSMPKGALETPLHAAARPKPSLRSLGRAIGTQTQHEVSSREKSRWSSRGGCATRPHLRRSGSSGHRSCSRALGTSRLPFMIATRCPCA